MNFVRSKGEGREMVCERFGSLARSCFAANCCFLLFDVVSLVINSKSSNHHKQGHTMPLGPRVLLTRSPTAIAPMNDDYSS